MKVEIVILINAIFIVLIYLDNLCFVNVSL